MVQGTLYCSAVEFWLVRRWNFCVCNFSLYLNIFIFIIIFFWEAGKEPEDI